MLFIMRLPLKQRNTLPNGATAYLSPLADIVIRADLELNTFPWLYRLFPSQVCRLPISFYRMKELNCGRGVYSESEEFYTALRLSFVVLLVAAHNEMKTLFPVENISNPAMVGPAQETVQASYVER